MLLNMDYECKPLGSVLVHSGGAKQDDGGSWVPLVFQVGPQKFQSGTAPQQEGGRAVVHRAQFTSLSEAKYIADEIARLAAT
jgi:hypothetical protein